MRGGWGPAPQIPSTWRSEDSIAEYRPPTSTRIPSGQDKNVARLGWQTKNNMGCAAGEPEAAGGVLSNALLTPGTTAGHKEGVLKSTVTSQSSTEKEVGWLEEKPEGRG